MPKIQITLNIPDDYSGTEALDLAREKATEAGIQLSDEMTDARVLTELFHTLLGLPVPPMRGQSKLTDHQRSERGKKARAARKRATKLKPEPSQELTRALKTLLRDSD